MIILTDNPAVTRPDFCAFVTGLGKSRQRHAGFVVKWATS